MVRAVIKCERCGEELQPGWVSILCEKCREKERSDRSDKLESLLENARCKSCGIKLDEENCFSLSPFLSGSSEMICNSCQEKEEMKRIVLNRIEAAEKREEVRIAFDKFMLENINYGIPKMYHHVAPALVDQRMLNNSVIIFGNFGTGKTYAAYGYLKYYRMRHSDKKDWDSRYHKDFADYTIIVKRAFTIMKDLKNAISRGTSEEVFESYLNKDILIIDEYGKNFGSDYEEATLFELINTRYEEMRQTIIIVNASNKNDLINLVRPDILDRFRGGIIEINGKSRR